jgi:hypothetical protein
LDLSQIPSSQWVVVYDEKLDEKISGLKKKYPHIKVKAGEQLKEFSSLEKLSQNTSLRRKVWPYRRDSCGGWGQRGGYGCIFSKYL